MNEEMKATMLAWMDEIVTAYNAMKFVCEEHGAFITTTDDILIYEMRNKETRGHDRFGLTELAQATGTEIQEEKYTDANGMTKTCKYFIYRRYRFVTYIH